MGNKSYIILVLIVVALAFLLDITSAKLAVEIGPKTILDSDGNTKTTLEVIYPLWHQLFNLGKNFLYGLAAAIFITVFVANRLEKHQQEEKALELQKLNEAININVFDSLFKTIIPEEIFRVIKQEIIENKVVRREAKWIYNFTLKENKVLCRQTIRYELHNLSQEEVIDPVTLDLDSSGGEKYELISAECHSHSGDQVVFYDHNDPTNKKNIEVVHNGNDTAVTYTVIVPSESYVEYKTSFERTYSDKVVDAQGTKVPVIGADIIVNYPEGFEFNITPMMSSKPKLITASTTQKIYRVDGGVLPNQGFLFYLTKST